jgi:hypothetical protein
MRQESPRVKPRPGTVALSRIADAATRNHAKLSGAKECIATFEMM